LHHYFTGQLGCTQIRNASRNKHWRKYDTAYKLRWGYWMAVIPTWKNPLSTAWDREAVLSYQSGYIFALYSLTAITKEGMQQITSRQMDQSHLRQVAMTGFVDNRKGQTNNMTSNNPLPLQELIACMQAEAQLWGDLLHISGGALKIPKCN
jgi:hypothetical protein